MKAIYLVAIGFLFLGCQGAKEVKIEKEAAPVVSTGNCKPTPVFNAGDTTGSFTGIVKRFIDTSADESSSCLVLLDGKGDSTFFYFLYDEIKQIDKGKVVVGSCVDVNYRALIDREGGEEVSRSFFLTGINYH